MFAPRCTTAPTIVSDFKTSPKLFITMMKHTGWESPASLGLSVTESVLKRMHETSRKFVLRFPNVTVYWYSRKYITVQ
eukprot:1787753-Rhodomonas_salina.2